MPQNNSADRDIRICFAVEPQLKERLNEHVPWGDVKKIYTAITEQLLDLMDEHDAQLIIAGILSKKLKLSTLIDYEKKDDDAVK